MMDSSQAPMFHQRLPLPIGMNQGFSAADVEYTDPAGRVSASQDVSVMDLDDTNGLSAEGLLLYLQTRLNGLDEQINGIFKKMQDMEKIRKLLNQMQNELNQLCDHRTKSGCCGTSHEAGKPEGYEKNLIDCIDAIGQIDPGLAQTLRNQFGVEGQILYGLDGRYLTNEVNNSRELLNSVAKQLESGAQLDMIRLQSLTATRGTAIQMATNTLATLNDSLKGVVHNIK